MKKWIKSFGHAWNGIIYLFSKERNAQIEGTIGILAIAMGLYFHIGKHDWYVIILCIALVLSLEAINTALEKTLDTIHPNINSSIGIAKDVAAGAVLLAAISTAIIGFIIFYPYLF
jgi:diacylglycerol kinase